MSGSLMYVVVLDTQARPYRVVVLTSVTYIGNGTNGGTGTMAPVQPNLSTRQFHLTYTPAQWHNRH